MNPEKAQGLSEEAAGWYARLHALDCSLEEKAEFAAWLALDRTHVATYLKVEQLHKSMEVLRNDPRIRALTGQALARRASRHPARVFLQRPWAQWASAAVITLCIMAVSALLARHLHHVVIPNIDTTITQTGDRAPLDDDSISYLQNRRAQ
ncbi:MAG: FecR/PupR family sigma factor regulator [Steroidobacteraceae bacterium]